MLPLNDLQRMMREAVLGEGSVHGIFADGALGAERYFQIHRNTTIITLTEALAAVYPATKRLVGEDFFAAAARALILFEPPDGPVLAEWGGTFPAFLEGLPSMAELEWIADVARLEWVRQAALHAADAEPVDAKALAAVPGERADDLRLTLHPSVRVVRSRWPVDTVWRENLRSDEPDAVNLDEGSVDLIVARPQADVTVARLPPGAAAFLNTIHGGGRLGAAAAEGYEEVADFELPGLLAHGLASGWFTGCGLD